MLSRAIDIQRPPPGHRRKQLKTVERSLAHSADDCTQKRPACQSLRWRKALAGAHMNARNGCRRGPATRKWHIHLREIHIAATRMFEDGCALAIGKRLIL